MCETRWTFYEPASGTNVIGLYHGTDSGHVIVYLNSKVMLIDFLIKESKSYSIYINDYLVEIRLIKDFQSFEYKMKIIPPPPRHSPLYRYIEHVNNWIKATFA